MAWTEATWVAFLCASIVACEPDDRDGVADMETSDGDPALPDVGGDESGAPVDPEGDVFLRNRVALDMDIRIRPLDDGVDLDCDAIADDPGALPVEAFAEGRVETLSPHDITVVLAHAPGARDCYAARVESEGLGARHLFWRDGDPPPGVAPPCCSPAPGLVELYPTPDGFALDLIGDTRLVHAPAD